MSLRRQLLKDLARLRDREPLDRPVDLEVVSPAELKSANTRRKERICADCTSGGPRHLIRIANDLSPIEAVDALIHEYAHAMHYERAPNARKPHGNGWGVCYAVSYRAYHGE